ncbi:MAG: amylo-alpha-1,6-glucosidase [Intrasporangium sp.]|uniref:glycogen debranching N-terminal domain-containing protein n=1 Tax=Intrasporangium sp. TaxID=1925024 RepID=UPI0026496115|nr:glycogen debranching N-terminal domain-containing protein [Intrasporangium sp.]MDN5796530.1 amylo-alpha-1,6-glucosidase [Intrasporangium sp.]
MHDTAESSAGQPWLHRLAICTDGNGTALSGMDGTMAGRGAEGFFVDDERVVSRLAVTLGGEMATEVSTASRGPRSEFFGSARGLGDDGPDPTVELHRSRELTGGRLVERVRVISRSAQAVSTSIEITVGGDGLDIAEVKSGATGGPILDPEVTDADCARWQSDRLATTTTFQPAPATLTSKDDGVHAIFPVTLEPGIPVDVTVDVTTRRISSGEFPADPGSRRVDWPERVAVEAADPRLARLLRTSLVDLRSLLLVDPADPHDVFAAAGTPWYLTLFGRDSIWTARMSLPLGLQLATGTLRALARRQGTRVDPSTAEEPGKIPHELRRAAYRDRVLGFTLPPVYYGTVDATALWICLLHDAWRWGMPEREVSALLPNLRSAVRWLTEVAASDDDGLLKYVDDSGHGLVNQGWKDSGDSMRFRDGTLAHAPIALVEAQAYAVEAARGATRILSAMGGDDDAGLVDSLAQWGDSLAERIRDRFWVTTGALPYLAMAVDGGGRLVDGVASNMGHVLGTGALTPEEAARVIETLMAPIMLGPYGIATLAADNGGFNPIGYHTGSVWVHDTAICALGMAREGHLDEAATVASRLLDAGAAFDYRFPELFSATGALGEPAPYPASCRPQAWATASAVAILTVLLGLEVDVPGRTVTVRPAPSAPFGPLRVGGLRIGEAILTISVDASGQVEVDGLPDGFTLDT